MDAAWLGTRSTSGLHESCATPGICTLASLHAVNCGAPCANQVSSTCRSPSLSVLGGGGIACASSEMRCCMSCHTGRDASETAGFCVAAQSASDMGAPNCGSLA